MLETTLALPVVILLLYFCFWFGSLTLIRFQFGLIASQASKCIFATNEKRCLTTHEAKARHWARQLGAQSPVVQIQVNPKHATLKANLRLKFFPWRQNVQLKEFNPITKRVR